MEAPYHYILGLGTDFLGHRITNHKKKNKLSLFAQLTELICSTYCSSEDTIKENEKATDWEETFAFSLSDKGIHPKNINKFKINVYIYMGVCVYILLI